MVMHDEFASAQLALDRLVNAIDASIPWQAEMLQRAKQLRERLSSDPQKAKKLLEEWERTTVRNLGL